jgi:hypothetical protein
MYTAKTFLYLFCLTNYTTINCTQQGPSSDLEFLEEKHNKTKDFNKQGSQNIVPLYLNFSN